MMQNGRSKPITTSLLAELTTVSVMRAIPRLRGSRPPFATSVAQALRRVVGFEPGRGALGLGLQIVAAVAGRDAPPLAEIGIGVAQPGAHRGAVDRLLEALGRAAAWRCAARP